MKLFLGLVMASALIIPALIIPARAAGTIGSQPAVASTTILVEGGCGHDAHRDERGNCRPNWREWDGRGCPRGWHLGAEGHKCWPN